MMIGPDCEKIAQLVSESLDTKLPWYQRILLQMHLFVCDTCKEFSKQIQLLNQMVHQLTHTIETDETIQLPQSAKQTIQETLRRN